jgi:xylose isomerase
MTLLNTDLAQEMNQMAAFLRGVVAYKKQLGSEMQLLLEPKPKEPTAHQCIITG